MPFTDLATYELTQKAKRTNLYIRGLPLQCTDLQLYNLFEKYGHIVSAKVIINLQSGDCKGYGFVMFADAVSAKRAMTEFTSNQLSITYAKVSTLC